MTQPDDMAAIAARVWREAYIAVYGCEPTHSPESYRAAHEVIERAVSAQVECIDELRKAVNTLRNGYADAAAGLAYVLRYHGRLSGVGFDRVADAFFKNVTMPEREGLLAGSHKLPAHLERKANAD